MSTVATARRHAVSAGLAASSRIFVMARVARCRTRRTAGSAKHSVANTCKHRGICWHAGMALR